MVRIQYCRLILPIAWSGDPDPLKVDSAFHPLEVGPRSDPDQWGQYTDNINHPESVVNLYGVVYKLLLLVVSSDSYIQKKDYDKLGKYQVLKEELKKMWKVKAKVIPVVVGKLRAVTSKVGEWLQKIPGTTSGLSVSRRVQC
uniref:Uncharacterized protein n=1 Tax=Micrurus carvalhoi TaxID=3147026 RepID=A0A2H6NDY7_9SAUR